MTIELSPQDYWDIVTETERAIPTCHSDEIDTTWAYPEQLGRGYLRAIELRPELELVVESHQLHDDLVLEFRDREHPVEIACNLISGESYLYGNGIALGTRSQTNAKEKHLEIHIHVEADLLKSLIVSPSEPIPPAIEQLLRDFDRPQVIAPVSQITPAMERVLLQILQCPYQGTVKRLYLESKVIELIALRLNQMLTEPRHRPYCHSLKPEDLDRVYYARETLLRQMDRPPSLIELARQVGLNDFKLKQGFRQVFGTTVFGYLHQHRLEKARQLLEIGDFNVSEVAKKVGFRDRSYFASAFRKKFGFNPSDYQRQSQTS